MPFPADITLPANAKYFSFKNTQNKYNPNYDIIWSFMYNVSNVSSQQGIATFVTPLSVTPTDVIPGQYLNTKVSETTTTFKFLTGTSILTRNPYNIITVAIDSTGYFALSSAVRPGIGIGSVTSNSLIVRSFNNEILYNQPLPASFNVNNSTNIIRCRLSNPEETLYIDYRTTNTTSFSALATVPLNFRVYNPNNEDLVYTGISFCSPLSTSSTSTASLILYNFHSEGVSNNTQVETITASPLT